MSILSANQSPGGPRKGTRLVTSKYASRGRNIIGQRILRASRTHRNSIKHESFTIRAGRVRIRSGGGKIVMVSSTGCLNVVKPQGQDGSQNVDEP